MNVGGLWGTLYGGSGNALREGGGTGGLTSSSADPMSPPYGVQHCQDILRDIGSTLSGTSKAWANVQPCVVHSVRILAQLAEVREKRLKFMEEKMAEVVQTVELLASDRCLKEERYHMDREAHEQAMATAAHSTRQLQEDVATLFKAVQAVSEGAGGSHQEQIHQQQLRQPTSPEAFFPNNARELDGTPLYRDEVLHDMIWEVQQLRQQWERFCTQSSRATRAAGTSGHGARSCPRAAHSTQDVDYGCINDSASDQGMESTPALPMPHSRHTSSLVCRWYWAGDQHSHFSRAVRRRGGGPAGMSPAIPWDEHLVLDRTTNRWRPVGFRDAVPEASAESSDFEWLAPAVIRVQRAGVYKITVCLVRENLSASLCSGGHPDGINPSPRAMQQPALISVIVNNTNVVHFGSSSLGTCVLLYGKNDTRTVSPQRSPSAPTQSMVPRTMWGGRVSPSSNARGTPAGLGVARSCCEPARYCTNSFSDYVFLPHRATLQVRFCHLSDTKAIHAAFLEVEHIV